MPNGFPGLTQPEGSTAQRNLEKISPSDPTFQDASLLVAAFAFAVVFASNKEDGITAIKNSVTVTTDEIKKSIALADNWTIRQKIMESEWPTDADQQAILIGLLEADQVPPRPVAPPGLYEDWSLDEIKDSTASAQRILDMLAAVPPDSSEPLPAPTNDGDLSLSIAVNDWLSRLGITDADISEPPDPTKVVLPIGLAGTQTQTFDIAELSTPWEFPVPAVLSVGGSNRWIADADGTLHATGPLVFDEVPEGTSLQEFRRNGYDTTFLPDDLYRAAEPQLTADFDDTFQLLRVGATAYVTLKSEAVSRLRSTQGGDASLMALLDQNYGKLVPDESTLGLGAGVGVRYWSDGESFYSIPYNTLTEALASPGSSGLPTTLHFTPDGGSLGAQLFKQFPTGSVVKTLEPIVEEADLGTQIKAFDQIIGDFKRYNSTWTSIGQAQTLQLQEGIAMYSNACNWMTNDLQRWEQFWKALAQHISS